MPDTHNSALPERVPHAALLHAAALLSGFGTSFLGPSLPALAAGLSLSDRASGALLAAQFTGAFLGGWTTSSPLRPCMLRGYVAAIAGFAMLAVTLLAEPHLVLCLLSLALLGFGIGQIITSNNLLAALRWTQNRGAALALLNFSWSVGALSGPVLLPMLLTRHHATTIYASFAALLIVAATATLLEPASHSIAAHTDAAVPERPSKPSSSPAALNHAFPRNAYLYFSLLLFLYGGVETSLSGWLATFDARYRPTLSGLAGSTAAFWLCYTAARAGVSALLLRLPERLVMQAGLLLAVGASSAMLLPASVSVVPLLAGLVGAALSPWFPVVLSGMVGEGAPARQAGRIIAVSGLGAAALPALVGVVSTHANSLRIGLTLPIAATVALLMLSLRRSRTAAHGSADPVAQGV